MDDAERHPTATLKRTTLRARPLSCARAHIWFVLTLTEQAIWSAAIPPP